MQPCKVAVVGCGNVAGVHLENLRASEDFEILAVADIREDMAFLRADQFGAKHWDTDYRELICLPEVDAVFVLTPPASHAKICVEALRAGKHVFCEKPLAMTSAECKAVTKAADKSGKTFLLGYPMRHSQDARNLREVIQSGRIGRPLLYRDVWALSKGSPSPAIHDAEQGGGVLFEHTHWLDFACWVLGRVRKVHATVARFKPGATTAADTFAATLFFESGDVAVWSESWAAAGFGWDPLGVGRTVRPTLDVIGPLGSLHFPDLAGGQALSLYESHDQGGTATERWDWETDWGVNADAYRREIDHFAACIKGDAVSGCTARDGLQAIALAEAILESSRREQVVTL